MKFLVLTFDGLKGVTSLIVTFITFTGSYSVSMISCLWEGGTDLGRT